MDEDADHDATFRTAMSGVTGAICLRARDAARTAPAHAPSCRRGAAGVERCQCQHQVAPPLGRSCRPEPDRERNREQKHVAHQLSMAQTVCQTVISLIRRIYAYSRWRDFRTGVVARGCKGERPTCPSAKATAGPRSVRVGGPTSSAAWGRVALRPDRRRWKGRPLPTSGPPEVRRSFDHAFPHCRVRQASGPPPRLSVMFFAWLVAGVTTVMAGWLATNLMKN